MDDDEFEGVSVPKSDQSEDQSPVEPGPEHPEKYTFDDWALI